MRAGRHREWRTGARRLRVALVVAAAALAGACGDRRDAADLAVGVAPFDQLRGMNVAALRSGGVRALRAAAAPAPFEGLREPIGAFDVLYAVPGFDGSDGSWPGEDALVSHVEASRAWPSDSSARAAWRSAIRAIQDGMGQAPQCADLAGPGYLGRIAEWAHPGGWSVSTTYAPAVPGDSALTARHAIAVRREALTARLPQAGQPNPNALPTWTRVGCQDDA